MVAILAALAMPVSNPYQAAGFEALETIRRDFAMEGSPLYGDAFVVGKKPVQVAFNWGCGVMLSALVSAAKADERARPWLRSYAEASRKYWNPAGPVAGYDVLPMPKSADRYYDDNAWMALSLTDAATVLGDPKFGVHAMEALRYALSGEDSTLGGGVFWRESDRKSKNTCSNAPTAAACLALYRSSKTPSLLAAAKRLYGWTRETLRDPEDGLYWDSIDLAGKIDKTKWSYNSALMLRSALGLYSETREEAYRSDAVDLAKASKVYWLKEGRIDDEGRFAHLLLEAWAAAAEAVPEGGVTSADLSAVLDSLRKDRDSAGRYPAHWGKPKQTSRVELLDQASAARAFLEVGARL